MTSWLASTPEQEQFIGGGNVLFRARTGSAVAKRQNHDAQIFHLNGDCTTLLFDNDGEKSPYLYTTKVKPFDYTASSGIAIGKI